MSSSCYSQYCSQNCCNYYRYCPTSSGSSLYSSCYYYYNDYNYTWATWWAWLLISLGIICFVAIVVAVIRNCFCRPTPNTVVVQGQDYSSQPYNQGYNNQGYNNQGYNNQGYNNQGYNNQGYNNNYGGNNQKDFEMGPVMGQAVKADIENNKL